MTANYKHKTMTITDVVMGRKRIKKETLHPLKPQQLLYAQEYIKDWKGKRAALAAGYSAGSARQISNELLKKPQVIKCIADLMKKRMKKMKIDADWVLEELKAIHELDILDIMEDDLSAFLPLKQWPKVWRTSISGIDLMTVNNADTDVQAVIKKIKWPDKTKNLDMICKHVDVKAYDKQEVVNETVIHNIMPVPTATSVEDWERQAQEQQEKALDFSSDE